MRTILLLLALWGSFSAGAVRRWWRGRSVDRRDDQLRRLLSGAVVPAPRAVPAQEKVPEQARHEVVSR